MFHKRKFLAHTVSALLALTGVTTGANAACTSIAGVWYLHGISVETTPNNDKTFGDAYKCTVTMNAGGDFANAPCVAYQADGGSENTRATGNITITGVCNFSGTVRLTNDPTLMTIRGGHFNGNVATAIATQGRAVLHFTLIKN